jgi:cytochrome c biogenesis protein CcmG/thiol:disulfide interchange protein DsbE
MQLRHGVVVTTLAMILATTTVPSARARVVSLTAGAPAPTFTLPAREGEVSLASLRGKVVYVDFWASWCEPCRRSFAWMKTLHEKYGERLVIVAIDLDKRREDADAFLVKNPAPFTIAYDPAGRVAESFRVAAMPSSFVVDPEGKVVHQQAGFDPKKTAEIEALLTTACAHAGQAATVSVP